MVEDSDHEDLRPVGPGWPATMVVGDRSRGRRETYGGFAALTGGRPQAGATLEEEEGREEEES